MDAENKTQQPGRPGELRFETLWNNKQTGLKWGLHVCQQMANKSLPVTWSLTGQDKLDSVAKYSTDKRSHNEILRGTYIILI